MNKDPLKDPRSDALNPSLGKEGNALFIVGGIRWIKRCSWWGWHAVPVSQCVCVCLWASLSGCVWFRWHPECICVYIPESDSILCVYVCVCVSVRWGGGRPASCSVSSSVSAREPSRGGNRRRALFSFNGHFMSSLMNVFIGYVMRTSYGWLVKLFNFINLGWNLLCRLKVV